MSCGEFTKEAALNAAVWAYDRATQAHEGQHWYAADRLFAAWRELCEVAFDDRDVSMLTDLAPSVLRIGLHAEDRGR